MADETTANVPPHREPLSLQVLEKMSALMTAAFGLVAALAWNEAIKAAINQYLPAGTGLRAMLVYALLVTVIAVLTTLWIAAAVNRVKKRIRPRREEHPPPGGPRGAPAALP